MKELVYLIGALALGWLAAPTIATWHLGLVNVGPPREPEREIAAQARISRLALVYRIVFLLACGAAMLSLIASGEL